MTDAAIDASSPRSAAAGASRYTRLVPAAVAAVIVGVLLGRFAFLDEEAPRSSAGASAVVDPSGAQLLATLEARVAAHPEDPGAWQQLATVATTAGVETGDIALFERAAEAVARAETLDPDGFGTRFARASLALTLHRFDEALEHGRAAVEQNPFSTEALGVVVDAQVELGHYEAATSDLQRMLDLDPGLPALARASYLRELHGDLPGALHAMQRAEVAGAPTGYRTAVAAALAGRLHLRLGQLDDAADAFARADTAEPGFEPALLGSATLQAVRGDIDGAIERVAAIDEPGAAAATLLGDLLRLTGRSIEADAADELVRTSLADEEAVGHVTDLDRAAFEADRGDDPNQAVDLARYAHGIRPENAAANEVLGWALVRSGEPAKAIPFVERSLRLGTADQATQVHAAAAFAAVGATDRAASLLRAAFEQPWTAFILHDVAQDLSAELGVSLPGGWPT